MVVSTYDIYYLFKYTHHRQYNLHDHSNTTALTFADLTYIAYKGTCVCMCETIP